LWWTKWNWGQVISEYVGFPCQSSFHQLLHNHRHLSSGAGTIGQLVADVPSGLSLTPPQETKKNRLELRVWTCFQRVTKIIKPEDLSEESRLNVNSTYGTGTHVWLAPSSGEPEMKLEVLSRWGGTEWLVWIGITAHLGQNTKSQGVRVPFSTYSERVHVSELAAHLNAVTAQGTLHQSRLPVS
jgi:hypothetical protein